ncbi:MULTISPECIES: 3,4-dihydroxy-2-butanone-4-phosphate synthase [unclassified Rhodococcus (in: high G+C Gram-positive bacteria)]|uniref:3,4-dihydroxy-2-butanone-4-phosphate synthase n=1 Tax=unclassified Rhodococcus (in: high G+C Gram-positive bacteria) TaxID=192944 RepID=UPI00163A5A52|nr:MULTISPECIES: 3,4-dihydroxy-2-butanone-4-phosphate synthase [unclassified Rhodococcus (in: high G+C Gram-positive bacteria)]MBC2637645.1 3,4-dihydroxy-2-butanone-4-phosphate synthase [Rhodococcus sp. 3A]MBC2897611.1 3,4-dihydroxy-2-butanone-4-phosphate synthase [Rhodococcus sp. 4CII]
MTTNGVGSVLSVGFRSIPDMSDSAAALACSAGEITVLYNREISCMVYAAQVADVRATAFAVRHGSGLLQVALPVERCDALQLPEAVPTERDPRLSAYGQCLGVDAADGVGTGISAKDRAHTARVLADPETRPGDLTRPGHVIVVRVDERAPFASVTVGSRAMRLVSSAGCTPAAVFTELVDPNEPTRMADGRAALNFAREHDLHAVELSGVTANISCR